MISPSYNFEDFVGAIREKGYLDVIFAAEQEATEAERLFYRFRRSAESSMENCREYAETLKRLIFYLRSAVMPYPLNAMHSSLFQSISEDLANREQ